LSFQVKTNIRKVWHVGYKQTCHRNLTSRLTGRITVVIVFAKEKTQKQGQPRRQLTTALNLLWLRNFKVGFIFLIENAPSVNLG